MTEDGISDYDWRSAALAGVGHISGKVDGERETWAGFGEIGQRQQCGLKGIEHSLDQRAESARSAIDWGDAKRRRIGGFTRFMRAATERQRLVARHRVARGQLRHAEAGHERAARREHEEGGIQPAQRNHRAPRSGGPTLHFVLPGSDVEGADDAGAAGVPGIAWAGAVEV